MGRLHTIVDKLNKEINDGASAKELLHTSKVLLIELETIVVQEGQSSSPPSVVVNTAPAYFSVAEKNELEQEELLAPAEMTKNPSVAAPTYDELEKEFSILKVNEEEVEAELKELQSSKETLQSIEKKSQPSELLLFDPVEDIPTLTHQSEQSAQYRADLNDRIKSNHEKRSVNESLKTEVKELGLALSNEPIKDLKKGIGINDSYLFINDLFRGDETMYTRSIKTINGFTNFAEAQFWIERELKLKLGWTGANEVVKHFDQLVRRRFS